MNNPKIDTDGNKYWFNDKGERHREDGSAVEWGNGDKEWFINGERHRKDEPAIECIDGSKWWFTNGKRHRGDGPVIEWSNGYKGWYLNDQQIDCKTQEEFENIKKLLVFYNE